MSSISSTNGVGQVGLGPPLSASASSSSPFVSDQDHQTAFSALRTSHSSALFAPAASAAPFATEADHLQSRGILLTLPDDIWEQIASYLITQSSKNSRALHSLSLTCTEGNRIFKWVIYGDLMHHPQVERLIRIGALTNKIWNVVDHYAGNYGEKDYSYSKIREKMADSALGAFFLLCDSVKDPDLRDNSIQTLKKWIPWFNRYLYGPIRGAVKSKDSEMIDLLAPHLNEGEIIHGAIMAIQMKDAKLLAYFLKLPNLRKVDLLLETAVETDQPDLVAQILSSGKEISKEYNAPANFSFFFGCRRFGLHSALLKAAQCGHLNCLEVLLTQGQPTMAIIRNVRDSISSLLNYPVPVPPNGQQVLERLNAVPGIEIVEEYAGGGAIREVIMPDFDSQNGA